MPILYDYMSYKFLVQTCNVGVRDPWQNITLLCRLYIASNDEHLNDKELLLNLYIDISCEFYETCLHLQLAWVLG